MPEWSCDPPDLSRLEGPLLAYGLGRSYGDVCLNDGGTLLDTTRMNRVIAFSHDTGRLHCEAGMSLTDILALVRAARLVRARDTGDLPRHHWRSHRQRCARQEPSSGGHVRLPRPRAGAAPFRRPAAVVLARAQHRSCIRCHRRRARPDRADPQRRVPAAAGARAARLHEAAADARPGGLLCAQRGLGRSLRIHRCLGGRLRAGRALGRGVFMRGNHVEQGSVHAAGVRAPA
jgi:hypothetical protein